MKRTAHIARLLSLLVLPIALGFGLASSCGGGSSAGTQFCGQFASTLCHKIYQCPDPAGPNPLAGSNEAECTNIQTHLCADPPPPGQTNDIACSGNVHVNSAAQTLCLMQITSPTCDEFNATTYTNNCDQVCTPAGTTGAAGSSGAAGTTGTAGTGGGGTTGTAGTGGSGGGPATPLAFCQQLWSETCDIEYRCTPTASQDATFMATYGTSVSACKGTTLTNTNCPAATTTCTTYDGVLAESCLTMLAVLTCTDLAAGNLPLECLFACE